MDIPISLSVKLKRLKINMEFQKKFFAHKVSITKQNNLFQIKKRKERRELKTNRLYSCIKQVYETSNIQEMAKLLSSGKWITIFATNSKNPVFVLGMIC